LLRWPLFGVRPAEFPLSERRPNTMSTEEKPTKYVTARFMFREHPDTVYVSMSRANYYAVFELWGAPEKPKVSFSGSDGLLHGFVLSECILVSCGPERDAP
jgi:hypothetical protein